MLIKLTPQQDKEFRNLRNSAVQEALVSELERLKTMLVTQSNPDAVKLLQGGAQAVLGILEQIDPERFSTNGKRG